MRSSGSSKTAERGLSDRFKPACQHRSQLSETVWFTGARDSPFGTRA